MSEPTSGGIELDQDLSYQRKTWKVERVGWAVMALLVGLALLGFLGSGPFSQARRSDESGRLSLVYERLSRHQTSTPLTIEVRGDAVAGSLALFVDREFLAGAELEQTLPQPDHVRIAGDRLVFSFRAERASVPVVIVFRLRPVTMGLRHGRLGVEGVGSLDFDQWVFP
jgi:hypothetical protein